MGEAVTLLPPSFPFPLPLRLAWARSLRLGRHPAVLALYAILALPGGSLDCQRMVPPEAGDRVERRAHNRLFFSLFLFLPTHSEARQPDKIRARVRL